MFQSGSEQCIQFALVLQFVQVVATADMYLADENLRYGAGAGNASFHFLAARGVAIDVNLFDVDNAFAFEQLFGANAVRADSSGIHDDFGHG
jgi:hypothetical protein